MAHVHMRSVQAWEAGISYPTVASLQALIDAYLRSGGFAAGREIDEAEALWTAPSVRRHVSVHRLTRAGSPTACCRSQRHGRLLFRPSRRPLSSQPR